MLIKKLISTVVRKPLWNSDSIIPCFVSPTSNQEPPQSANPASEQLHLPAVSQHVQASETTTPLHASGQDKSSTDTPDSEPVLDQDELGTNIPVHVPASRREESSIDIRVPDPVTAPDQNEQATTNIHVPLDILASGQNKPATGITAPLPASGQDDPAIVIGTPVPTCVSFPSEHESPVAMHDSSFCTTTEQATPDS